MMKDEFDSKRLCANSPRWFDSCQWARLGERRNPSNERLLLGLLAGLGLGCAAPTLGPYNCEIPCKKDAECSDDGMICRDQLCVHPGMPGSCAVGGAGAQGGAAAGSSEWGGTSGSSASGLGGNAGKNGLDWGGTAGNASSFGGAIGTAGTVGTGESESEGGVAGGNQGGTGTGGTTHQGGGAGSFPSGVGGSGGIGGGPGGSGGTTTGAAGTVGTAGVAGSSEANCGPYALNVQGPWCTNVANEATLTACAGVPPYAWSAGRPIPGVTFTTAGAMASLKGTPSAVGSFDPAAVLEDATHTQSSYSVAVSETPVITTASVLPAGCSSQVYVVELAAAGGPADQLEWSSTLPPELGLTLTGNKLSGVLGKASDYEFFVTVRNKLSGCVSSQKRFQISVSNDMLSPDCPAIAVAGKAFSTTLVPPYCRGWPYTVPLTGLNLNLDMTYSWQALALPSDLTFDSMTQTITGTPTIGGPITVQLTESTGRIFQRKYDVPMRDKCWFAYLDGNSGAQRLHLTDPYLGHLLKPPDTSSASGISVVNFQFSPNGRFLAYRVKDASNVESLWLWQGPQWDHEQLLTFEPGSSVAYYAWSDDSVVLAVAYTASDGSTKLGGIDVSEVPAVQTVSGVQGIRKLDAIAAPVKSTLTWYQGGTHVAFYSPIDATQPQGAQKVSYADLGQSGFSNPVTVSAGAAPYDSTITLYSSGSGFFATNQVNPVLYFYGPQQFLHGNEAVAPSGGYTASASNDIVRVYRANSWPLDPTSVPLANASGCTALLAWGGQQERIACINGSDTAIHVYTLDTNFAELHDTKVAGSEGVSGLSWRGHGRSISARSNWLALVTDDKLHVVSLGQAIPTVAWTRTFTGSSISTGMSFSPDEAALILQRDRDLRLYDVRLKSIPMSIIGATGAAVPSCQEDQLSIPSWCGRNSALTQPIWSFDSGLVAFHSDTAELAILDVRARSDGTFEDPIVVVGECASGCMGSFRFQP